MNLGKNLQYLRMLHNNITQEELANRLQVSRQTISKWELNQANPEVSKIKEICTLFNCTADDLLFGNIDIRRDAYKEIQIESLDSFRYTKYTVISNEPEDDAISKIKTMADKMGISNPRIIGWDFPCLSQEQINVYHMHGYTAALILENDFDVDKFGIPVETIDKQNYISLIIKNPMDNPFDLISNAYKSIFQYINVNRYVYNHFAFEQLFYVNGIEYMKVCVAIQ